MNDRYPSLHDDHVRERNDVLQNDHQYDDGDVHQMVSKSLDCIHDDDGDDHRDDGDGRRDVGDDLRDDDDVLMNPNTADHPYDEVNMDNHDCHDDDDVQDKYIDLSTDCHHQHVYQQGQKTRFDVQDHLQICLA